MQRAAWSLLGLPTAWRLEVGPALPIRRALHGSSCLAQEQEPPSKAEGDHRMPSTSQQQPSSRPASAVARSLMAQFDADPTGGQQQAPGRAQRRASPQAAPEPSITEEPTSDVVRLVLRAVENCKPQLLAKQFRSGNRVVTVPYMVHPKEQRSLAIRWILEAAHKRKEGTPGAHRRKEGTPGVRRGTVAECLATELLLAAQKQGAARAKRDEMHRLAVENRNNMRR